MKRRVIYSGVIISILLVIAFVLPMFFDYLKYKQSIESTIKAQLGLEAKIKGGIHFSILPLPNLSIENVDINTQEGSLAKGVNLKVSPAFLSPSDFTSNVSIKIQGGKVRIEQLKKYFSSGQNSFNQHINSIKVDNVSLTDSGLNKEHKLSYKIINSYLKKGSIFSNNIFFEFNLEHTKYPNFTISGELPEIGSLSSKQSNINFFLRGLKANAVGKVDTHSKKFVGTLDAEILNKSSVKADSVLSIIPNADSLNFKGQIEITPNLLKIFQSEPDSNVHGNLSLYFLDGWEIDGNMVIEELKIKEIPIDDTNKGLKQANKLESLLSSILTKFQFELPANLAGSLKLDLKEVLVNGSAFSSSINLNIFDKHIFLDKLEIKGESKAKLEVEGTIEHNGYRPKFSGNFYLETENIEVFFKSLGLYEDTLKLSGPLRLASNVTVMPRRLMLRKTRIMQGQTLIGARSDVMSNASGKLTTHLGIRLQNFNADSFGITSELDNILFIHYVSDKDKTGKIYNELTNNFKWLRTFDSNLNLDLHFDVLQIKGQQVKNFDVAIELSPNNLTVNTIRVTSPNMVINDGTFALQLALLRPQVHLDLDIDYLDTSFLYSILPSKEVLEQKLSSLPTLEIRGFSTREEVMEHYRNSISYYGIQNYDGQLKFKVKNLRLPYLGDNNITGIKGNVSLNGGFVTLNELEADAFGGKFVLVGNLNSIETIPSFALSFSINNIDPKLPFYLLTRLDKVAGYLSLGGTINSRGLELSSIMDNLTGAVEFIGRDFVWQGFDLGELVRITELNMNLSDRMQRLRYYKEQGESIFTQAIGKINISGGVASINKTSLTNERIQGMYAANYLLKEKSLNSVAKFAFYPIGAESPITLSLSAQGGIGALSTKFDTTELEQLIRSNG